jgi:hypothetical protein
MRFLGKSASRKSSFELKRGHVKLSHGKADFILPKYRAYLQE